MECLNNSSVATEMAYFPSKSTISLQNNFVNLSKACVDCDSSNMNHYSFGYKVYLCQECAQVHDLYLGKYSSGSQSRYQKSSHCPLIELEDPISDLNASFNKEYESFLPQFYQKLGHKTPQVCYLLLCYRPCVSSVSSILTELQREFYWNLK